MVTRIYIEALLVDEEIADAVWAAWPGEAVDDEVPYLAWMLVALSP